MKTPRTMICVCVCLMINGIATCAELPASTAPSSTQPSLDRHTPDGAMNAFYQAVQKGDTATIVDSSERREDVDRSWQETRALALIADAKFFHAAESRFGHDAAVRICYQCRFRSAQPLREFIPDDFKPLSSDVNTLVVNPLIEAGPQILKLDADGIWRFAEIYKISPQIKAFQNKVAEDDISRKEGLINAINAGRDPAPTISLE